MVLLRLLINGDSGARWHLPSLHDVWVEGKHVAPSRGLGELRGLKGRVGSSQHFPLAKRLGFVPCSFAGLDWIAFT